MKRFLIQGLPLATIKSMPAVSMISIIRQIGIGPLLAIALWLPQSVFAQPGHTLKPNDFAFGIPLEVDGDGALYSFDLPTEVCRYSTRPDLADMRIFNSYGEAVPYLLQPVARSTEVEPVSLPFFPVQVGADGMVPGQINIAMGENGALLDLWQRAAVEQGTLPGVYLIDASAQSQTLLRLMLEWSGPEEDFVLPIQLESSNDLANWSAVESKASLVAMNWHGRQLHQGVIPLPFQNAARYYRLRWPLGEEGMVLESVTALPAQAGDEKPRRWQRYEPNGNDGDEGLYQYHVKGYYPFDRARVILPQGSLLTATLSSGETARGAWQEQFHGLLYHLFQNGQVLENSLLRLTLTDANEWKLALAGKSLTEEPILELGWLPPRVYFEARGEAPFVLAFAAAKVGRPSIDSSILLTDLQQSREGEGFVKSALPGPVYELGGMARLGDVPPATPWQQWLLWSTLSIGVLIVVLMARSLYRQSNNDNRTE